jgi:hypothetical protein
MKTASPVGMMLICLKKALAKQKQQAGEHQQETAQH